MALACSMLDQMLGACTGYVHVSKVVDMVSQVLDKVLAFMSKLGEISRAQDVTVLVKACMIWELM
jgi:hypothetical protein